MNHQASRDGSPLNSHMSQIVLSPPQTTCPNKLPYHFIWRICPPELQPGLISIRMLWYTTSRQPFRWVSPHAGPLAIAVTHFCRCSLLPSSPAWLQPAVLHLDCSPKITSDLRVPKGMDSLRLYLERESPVGERAVFLLSPNRSSLFSPTPHSLAFYSSPSPSPCP